MIIKIPFKTPTINHLYFHRGNIKILTTEARKCRNEIISIIDDIDKSKIELLRDERLVIKLYINENWLLKDNITIARKDLFKREKFLIDSVFMALGIDDKFIFEAQMFKVQNLDEEYTLMEIMPLDCMG